MSLKLPKIPSTVITEEKALICYAAWGKYNLVFQELSYTSKSKRM